MYTKLYVHPIMHEFPHFLSNRRQPPLDFAHPNGYRIYNSPQSNLLKHLSVSRRARHHFRPSIIWYSLCLSCPHPPRIITRATTLIIAIVDMYIICTSRPTTTTFLGVSWRKTSDLLTLQHLRRMNSSSFR